MEVEQLQQKTMTTNTFCCY